MRKATWSPRDELFVPEVDGEHKAISEAISALQSALATNVPSESPSHHAGDDIAARAKSVFQSIESHFAHEEELMLAGRYTLYDWHKRQHDYALTQLRKFVSGMESGDPQAANSLVTFLTDWLRDHSTRSDKLMGAFLRSRQLSG